MFKQLNIWKNVWNLFLRYVMICVFMFMCVVIISTNSSLLGPIFGVFYFIALIYYFWFTMKVEGELDVNREKVGQMPRFRFKGAVCALILAIPLILFNLVPNFFADPVFTPTVELDEAYGRIRPINCEGQIDGKRVHLSDIPPFGFAGFEVLK